MAEPSAAALSHEAPPARIGMMKTVWLTESMTSVLIVALGDHASVHTALLALAAVLLLTLPLAWQVRRGLVR